jgi:sec-independent protein translocase protein TatC
MPEQSDQSTEKIPEGGGILSHLHDLRGRIIKSLLFMAIGFGVAFNFADQILAFLVMPLKAVLPPGQKLIYTGLPDGFLVSLKIGLWGGVFLSAPLWLYQVWAFVAPGLYRSERKKISGLACSATLLLFLGAGFGYALVLPLAFKFFVGFSNDLLMALPDLKSYFTLAMSLLLAFGLVFQLPLVILFMAGLGLVSSPLLIKGRKYAILLIFIVAAILTPPDILSQILMAIPMMGLYELSIRLVAKNERKQAAEEAASEKA